MMLWTVFLLSILCLYTPVSPVFGYEFDDDGTFGACDDDSVSVNLPFRNFAPNQFYKVCAGNNNEGSSRRRRPLNNPKCGDGNLYGWFASKPVQAGAAEHEKIVIELSGGGACWSSFLCQMNSYYLSFPHWSRDLAGRSCSEAEYGITSSGTDVTMLCTHTFRGNRSTVDLSTYTYILVPYCTQDVHTGDAIVEYDDGSTIYHHGAHNIMAVVRWIRKNFRNPRHIVLTGCSGGGTALPLVYALLNNHYNRRFKAGLRNTQISLVADSPVYLTPEYFLENVIDQWNPWTMAKMLGFDYETHKYDNMYSTVYGDYILSQGSNRDKWGFVGHTVDPVSEIYYKWMSGNGNEEEDAGDWDIDWRRQRGRQLLLASSSSSNEETVIPQQESKAMASRVLEDEGENNYESWWTELNDSLGALQQKHSNVKTFWIDESQGHCTFGLYHPLLSDGFEEWAADIMAEDRLVAQPNRGHFLAALTAGGLLFAALLWTKRATRSSHGGEILAHAVQDHPSSDGGTYSYLRGVLWSVLEPLTSFPVVTAYAFAITVFFVLLLLYSGWAHPVNNTSLGPTAQALSSYGILNPSLVVRQRHYYRLISSSFLCSGVISWLVTMVLLWAYCRPLEQNIGSFNMAVTMGCIGLGANLVYTIFGEGASCGSLPLVLGILMFHLVQRHERRQSKGCWLITSIVFFSFFGSVLLSFTSWIVVLASLALGASATFLFSSLDVMSKRATISGVNQDTFIKDEDDSLVEQVYVVRQRRLYGFLGTLGVLLVVVLCKIPRPDPLYEVPYFTGCEIYSSDDIGQFVSGFADFRRRLEEEDDDYDNVCAQFCVPNVASKFTAIGAQRVVGVEAKKGTCSDQGYEEHWVDKTVSFSSYAIDVEVYYLASDVDDDEENR